MSPKHTPGPWRANARRNPMAIECRAAPEREPFGDPTAEQWGLVAQLAMVTPADLRLMAAAPELLEALRELASFAEGYAYDKAGLNDHPVRRLAERARAAIAKAEGSK